MKKLRDSRFGRAGRETAAFGRNHPLISGLTLGLPGTISALIAAFSSSKNLETWEKIGLALAGGIGGAIVVLAITYLWYVITAPRHKVEDRVADLEEQMREHRDQILSITQGQYGDRDRFVPTYQDLRTSVRDAHGRIKIAIEERVLWDRSASFNLSPWDKNKDDLANHPYAQEDGAYGPCSEAFEHLRRLNVTTIWRLRNRPVKAGDNLDGALGSLEAAETCLTDLIGKAQPNQPL